MNNLPIHALTTITRTQVIDGIVTPAIIRNGNYYFINLQVYRDGLVNCWEMVDLDLFRQKLATRWVVPAIPDGQTLSIFSLGAWEIGKGNWLHSKESYYDYICSLVRHLNPRLENLYNCHGSTTEKKGNVNVSIFPLIQATPYRELDPEATFPKRISGESFSIFYKDEKGCYYLAALSLFTDGGVAINHTPEPVRINLPQVRELAAQGRILTDMPLQTPVTILGLGAFQFQKKHNCVAVEDKLLELEEAFRKLNGGPGAVEQCRSIFEQYLKTPTLALKQVLKAAYENIPSHQRIYVGDMDTKDIPVRMVLYGEQEIEKWSHYQVAKQHGEPLPHISVPKPEDP